MESVSCCLVSVLVFRLTWKSFEKTILVISLQNPPQIRKLKGNILFHKRFPADFGAGERYKQLLFILLF